jgi:hypothetical protein
MHRILIAAALAATSSLSTTSARADLRTQAVLAAEKERVPRMDYSTALVRAERRLTSGRVTGWAPSLHVDIYGKSQDGDLVLAVLKRGKKKLGQVQCRMPAINPKWKFETARCKWGDDVHIKRAGPYAIEVLYQYVTESMETRKASLGTLKFDILKYKIHKNAGTGFVVDREPRLGEAYADFYRADDPYLRLAFFFKYRGTQRPAQFLGRCFVDGKPVGYKKAGLQHMLKFKDNISYRAWKGNKQLAEIGWTQAYFFVPGIYSRDRGTKYSPTPAYMAKLPGKWVCKIMFDGTVIRELSFTVKPPAGGDPDPVIEPHPAQARVFTGYRHLVSVKQNKGWKHGAPYKPAAKLAKKALHGAGL